MWVSFIQEIQSALAAFAGRSKLYFGPDFIVSDDAANERISVALAGNSIHAPAWASTIALDLAGKGAIEVALAGATTIANPTSIANLVQYVWIIKQPNAGSTYSVTWGSSFKFGSQFSGTVTASLGAIDIFTFRAYGGALRCVGTAKGVHA